MALGAFRGASLRGGANGAQRTYTALPPQNVKIGSLELPRVPYVTLAGAKRRPWGLAAVVPKDEFVEIDLELGLTYSVIGADQPLLEISNSANSPWSRNYSAIKPV